MTKLTCCVCSKTKAGVKNFKLRGADVKIADGLEGPLCLACHTIIQPPNYKCIICKDDVIMGIDLNAKNGNRVCKGCVDAGEEERSLTDTERAQEAAKPECSTYRPWLYDEKYAKYKPGGGMTANAANMEDELETILDKIVITPENQRKFNKTIKEAQKGLSGSEEEKAEKKAKKKAEKRAQLEAATDAAVNAAANNEDPLAAANAAARDVSSTFSAVKQEILNNLEPLKRDDPDDVDYDESEEEMELEEEEEEEETEEEETEVKMFHLTEAELEKMLNDRYWDGYNQAEKDRKKPREKKEKAPKKERAEYAKPNKVVTCQITNRPVKTISSFKFAESDMKKPTIIRFLNSDGKYIEYAPEYCYKHNTNIKEYLDESNTFEKMKVWSNSTKKLPGWKFRKGIDYIEYGAGVELDDEARVEHQAIIKAWFQ